MRILLAGGGQVAQLIARRLTQEGNEVTIVERDPERCAHLEEELDAKVVKGDATSVSDLRRAGIADAEMLIAVTSSDEANLPGVHGGAGRVERGDQDCPHAHA